MTDNIKPEHYRTGEIDLYEAFSQIFPHNEYRAGMQMIAMRYMFRDKIDRVEDLKKAIYTLERLKEKEIEYRKNQEKERDDKMFEEAFADKREAFGGVKTKIVGYYLDEPYLVHGDLLGRLLNDGYRYLARDESGALYAFNDSPFKFEEHGYWDVEINLEYIGNDNFPEVQWSDEEPTKITDILDIYLNGGENGK